MSTGGAAASAAVRKRGKTAPKVLALWVLLIVMFLSIWQFMSPATPSPHAHVAYATAPPALPSPYVVLAVFAGVMGVTIAFSRRGLRRLAAASRLLAHNDLGPAEEAFRAIAKSRTPGYAAQAEGVLTGIAIRRGRFADALVLVERAIGRVAKSPAFSDHLVPELLARRAYILAALDRSDEALAELATLAAAHPTFAQLTFARLLTRTMVAVRRGDIAAASALASQRSPDFGLSLYDELLVDVLTTTTEPRPPKVEVERLRGELNADPELRAWLQLVWAGGERALDEAMARAA